MIKKLIHMKNKWDEEEEEKDRLDKAIKKMISDLQEAVNVACFLHNNPREEGDIDGLMNDINELLMAGDSILIKMVVLGHVLNEVDKMEGNNNIDDKRTTRNSNMEKDNSVPARQRCKRCGRFRRLGKTVGDVFICRRCER